MTDSHIPGAELHQERNLRFSQAFNLALPLQDGRPISSHALLLEIDLRIAYCAGAWLSVIVLAQAAIEAQARQVTTGDYRATSLELFASDPDLQWLRMLRNELVHAAEPGTPSQVWKVPATDFGTAQQALESEATRALQVMFRTIYSRTQRQSRKT
jgi:hypothetical protein